MILVRALSPEHLEVGTDISMARHMLPQPFPEITGHMAGMGILAIPDMLSAKCLVIQRIVQEACPTGVFRTCIFLDHMLRTGRTRATRAEHHTPDKDIPEDRDGRVRGTPDKDSPVKDTPGLELPLPPHRGQLTTERTIPVQIMGVTVTVQMDLHPIRAMAMTMETDILALGSMRARCTVGRGWGTSLLSVVKFLQRRQQALATKCAPSVSSQTQRRSSVGSREALVSLVTLCCSRRADAPQPSTQSVAGIYHGV